jgi:hypothetical protein
MDRRMGWYGPESCGSGWGPVEHGNEPVSFIKCWEILE